MRYFCPGCWGDFGRDLARCPHCGLDIRAFFESKGYVEKLLLALGHPEQGTVIRAAWILGQRREAGAVDALADLAGKTPDVYIAQAAVEALGRIDTPEAFGRLRRLAGHPARMVREEVELILARRVETRCEGAEPTTERNKK